MIREVALATFANTATKAFHSGVVHTSPLVCSLVNLYVTDVIIKASHCIVIIPLGLAYCIANYMTTKAQGKPVYSFLTWEDHTSFVIVAGLFMATFAIFWLLAVFT